MFKNFFYSLREKNIFIATLIGTAVNILLMIIKFIAGIVGHSSAMIADAANSLSDFITDFTMLLFVRISCKPSDEHHRYGHGKYETLASALIAIAMMILGISLLVGSVDKVLDAVIRHIPIITPEPIALITAIVTIVFKTMLFFYTKRQSIRLKSSSLRAKAFDHRNDVFISAAVLIGISAAMFLGKGWVVLEPIAAAIVSIIIIYTGTSLLMPAVGELLEKSLPKEVQESIHTVLQEEPRILSYHKIHTRSIGSRYAIEADIRVKGSMSVLEAHRITQQIEDRLRNEFGEQTHVIIHVEPEEETDRDQD